MVGVEARSGAENGSADCLGTTGVPHEYFAHTGPEPFQQWNLFDSLRRKLSPPQFQSRSQFIEEVQQEGDLDIPLLVRGCAQIGDYCEELAVCRSSELH
jgi:hypothetical protein